MSDDRYMGRGRWHQPREGVVLGRPMSDDYPNLRRHQGEEAMTAETLTLTDFLLARIAEDEDAALTRAARSPSLAGQLYPTRAMAECEAKRRIVGELRDRETSVHDPLDVAVYHLAAVYADHPDYREEWRP